MHVAVAYLHVCSTRRADYLAYHPPPSLASATRRIFTPCEESDSCMVLISNARGIERAATAVRSSSGMSVQPDISIFISAPPPLRDVGYLAHAEVKPLHVVFSRAVRGA
jgi:hypothetical protein